MLLHSILLRGNLRLDFDKITGREEKTMRGNITVAHEKGSRTFQEDRYLCLPVYSQVPYARGWLLAVMDGHSHTTEGYRISELCQKHIPSLYSLNHPEQAEQSLLELTQKLVRMSGEEYQGSTLSLALVLESHHTVSVAVLGDSPVVVVNEEETHVAPIHNVNVNDSERILAENRGGLFENGYLWIKQSESNDRRPYGVQPTRCLGDMCMKHVILREPQIITKQLTHKTGVLLATDGAYLDGHSSMTEESEYFASLVRVGATADSLIKDRTESLTDNATLVLWSTF